MTRWLPSAGSSSTSRTGVGALVWLPDIPRWARVVAGLRIDFVHEHDFELLARFDSLQRQEDGTYRFPPGQPRVPMQFSLRASAAGTR